MKHVRCNHMTLNTGERMKSLFFFALLALVLTAAGCSMEPSDADLQSALEKSMVRTNESLNQTAQMFGGAGKALTDMIGKVEVHSVRKIGCVQAAGSPGYVCDFEVDMTVPIAGRSKKMEKARFVKGPEGWVIAESE